MSEHPSSQGAGLPPRNKFKLCLLAVATIPFVVKVVYLNRAWVSSPLDRTRLGLWGSAALLTVFVAMCLKLVKRFPAERPICESRSLRVLPLPLLVYVAGLVLDLNAVQLVGSVGILWATAWMLYGRTTGILLAPAAVFAVLAVPGSSYWLGKAASAFTAPVTAAYAPAFDAHSQKGYLGREVPPTESFIRFFRTSDAHQFRYASRRDEVAVLAVRIGNDIHEVHPATHCLRSSGWTVRSEEARDVALTGREGPLAVTEAIVENRTGGRMLMWVWYSSASVATGSFIRFRHLYATDEAWYTYQLTTFLGRNETPDDARQKLCAFLAAGGETK